MIKITHMQDGQPPADLQPVNLRKPRQRAPGAPRIGKGDPQAKLLSEKAVHAMVEAGVVGKHGDEKLSDDEILQQFIMLENIGAPADAMQKILGCSPQRLQTLRFQAREVYISTLTSDGVLGTIGTAFHRIENAAKKIMAQMASLQDNDPRQVELSKSLVDFETKKVDLLVRTGAVKIKRKVEISGVFDQGQIGDPSLVSGEKAMQLLQLIAMDMTDAGDLDIPQ